MPQLPEKKLRQWAVDYKLCRDVTEDECPMSACKFCSSCMHRLTENGWGSGECPDVCSAVTKIR